MAESGTRAVKFRIEAHGKETGEVRRVAVRNDQLSFAGVRSVAQSVSRTPAVVLRYLDDEGEKVTIGSEAEFAFAVASQSAAPTLQFILEINEQTPAQQPQPTAPSSITDTRSRAPPPASAQPRPQSQQPPFPPFGMTFPPMEGMVNAFLPMWIARITEHVQGLGVAPDSELVRGLNAVRDAQARGAQMPELIAMARSVFEVAKKTPEIARLLPPFFQEGCCSDGDWNCDCDCDCDREMDTQQCRDQQCDCCNAGQQAPPPIAVAPVASLVSHVTIDPGCQVLTGQKYVKIWRISNTGSTPWPSRCRLAFVTGDITGAQADAMATGGAVAPGESVDVALDFQATEPRRHVGFFQLTTPSGFKFGPLLQLEVMATSP